MHWRLASLWSPPQRLAMQAAVSALQGFSQRGAAAAREALTAIAQAASRLRRPPDEPSITTPPCWTSLYQIAGASRRSSKRHCASSDDKLKLTYPVASLSLSGPTSTIRRSTSSNGATGVGYPIIGERSETIGRGVLDVSLSYSHVSLNHQRSGSRPSREPPSGRRPDDL